MYNAHPRLVLIFKGKSASYTRDNTVSGWTVHVETALLNAWQTETDRLLLSRFISFFYGF